MYNNLLTVDVEDWYQSSSELLRTKKSGASNHAPPTERVVINTERLLSILASKDIRATFFVLGSVAETFPELVRRIQRQGHELATHGYSHSLLYKQSPQDFLTDLVKSMALIEGITKEKLLGYRAPYWSIKKDSLWVLNTLAEQGLRYDSSLMPTKTRFGGSPYFPQYPCLCDGLAVDKGTGFVEFPLSIIRVLGFRIPLSGGYFRVLPYWFIRRGIKEINRSGKPVVIGLHPYELDTEELKERQDIPFKVIMTQNLNRARTEAKLNILLSEFPFAPIRESLGKDIPYYDHFRPIG
jgi:polysaccharide deacetylase family protein (PEP-CTERM system associated)